MTTETEPVRILLGIQYPPNTNFEHIEERARFKTNYPILHFDGITLFNALDERYFFGSTLWWKVTFENADAALSGCVEERLSNGAIVAALRYHKADEEIFNTLGQQIYSLQQLKKMALQFGAWRDINVKSWQRIYGHKAESSKLQTKRKAVALIDKDLTEALSFGRRYVEGAYILPPSFR